MEARGITFPDTNAEAVAMGICNSLYFFRDVMKQVKGTINRVSFMDAVNRMGTSFEAASVFGTRFSAAQHDGVANARNYAWDGACGCMAYTSGNVAVP
jgi:hypothetical protein